MIMPVATTDGLLDVLRRRLLDAGARNLRAQAKDGSDEDLAFELRRAKFSVELMVSRDARMAILRGLLAEAILRSRARGRRTLAMVGAPSISDSMVEELQRFVAQVAPDQPWGLVDGRGRLQLHVGPAPIVLPPSDATAARPRVRPARPALFSDLHQWLLKVLLAPELPDDLLTAPRERVTSARSLARVAQVSLGSAARCLVALEGEGHLARDGKRLVLVRRQELLEAWRAASRPRSSPVGLRWTVAPSRPKDALPTVLERLERTGPCAVGLYGASDALGLGFVRGAKPHIFVEQVEHAVERLREVGLAPSDAADMFLDQPAAPRSCFAGVVRRGGLATTDVLQTWLDVSWHPARGQEQAQVLWDRVLAPKLVDRRGSTAVDS